MYSATCALLALELICGKELKPSEGKEYFASWGEVLSG